MSEERPKKTHFGYEHVSWEDKQKRVNDVFHSVSQKYDLMNDLMTGGLHRLWKTRAIHKLLLSEGMRVLDLAGGTGDLSARIVKKIGPRGEIVLADINQSMLQEGVKRLDREGLFQVQYACVNAEALPFPDQYFDALIIGFGLRNVRDQARALQEMQRVLKPMGRALILEFSEVHDALKKPYDWYSFKILPRIGKWVAKDEASYQYLAESIRKHPNQKTLQQMMYTAGFNEVTYENILGGVVALHLGWKY